MKKKTDNRTIEILQHNISYWYNEDQEMPECEEEYIKEMIIEGYSSGELNCLMPDDSENRGWWEIKRA